MDEFQNDENFQEDIMDLQRRPGRNQDARWITNARIENINSNRRDTLVTVVYRQQRRPGMQDNQRITLRVDRNTRIFNENRQPISENQLQRGMIIDAFISEVMTRSNPPIAQAFQIIVVRSQREPERDRNTTVGRIAQVNQRNNSILVLSANNNTPIIFNLAPNAVIIGLLGRRIQINDLLPGLRVRVEHAYFMTASIPPQTTAFVIQVIA